VTRRFKGVIFDMDGVLVDSEPAIAEAAIRALAKYGVKAVRSDFTPFVGAGEDRFIGGVAEKHGLAYTTNMKAETYDVYDEIIGEYIRLYDNAADCVAKIKSAGYITALASAADRRKVEANLRAACIPAELFEVLLTGEDVKNKKPDPDIYILAGKRIGLSPSECVVIEDAVNGVKAAKAAGMAAVGVLSAFSAETLIEAGADYIIKDISGLPEFLGL